MTNLQPIQEEASDFIMRPTVDFCFKELMQNPNIRRNVIAALLNLNPADIPSTELLPTVLDAQYPDDKYGILDVRILLSDNSQIDLEMQVAPFAFWSNRVLFYLGKMYTGQLKKGDSYDQLKKCIHVSILDFIHFPDDQTCFRKISLCDEATGKKYTDLLELYILELKKLPPDAQNDTGIIRWMRFFTCKNREEFEAMAKNHADIEEAYDVLKKISADDQKRLAYEARERALLDYNTQMKSSRQYGREEGRIEGHAEGRAEERTKNLAELASLIYKKQKKGCSPDEIADMLERNDVSYIAYICEMLKQYSDDAIDFMKIGSALLETENSTK